MASISILCRLPEDHAVMCWLMRDAHVREYSAHEIASLPNGRQGQMVRIPTLQLTSAEVAPFATGTYLSPCLRQRQRESLLAVLLSLLVAVLVPGCPIFSFLSPPAEFIGVLGTQLTEGDSPYYFAGTNYWYGPYLGSSGQSGDRPRLIRDLDTLSAHGLMNLRILGWFGGLTDSLGSPPQLSAPAGCS